MDQKFKEGPEYPMLLDNNDPLGHFRRRFYIKKGTIYMCGNSLGLASEDAERAVLNVLEKWKEEGVQIWNADGHKYHLYSEHLAALMAELVGADADEIAFGGSTTINIHQAVSTLYKPTRDRYKILVDDVNFPTDRYAIDSQVRLRGYEPEDAVKVVQCRGTLMDERDILDAMTPDVALVLLPTVYYRTAQVLDMSRLTAAAKQRGIVIGWDLSHAVGSVQVDLKAVDADFAVWCTYKYLNGGPGSTAGLYVNRRHFDLLPGLAGWHGNRAETQFRLLQRFDHRRDANGWLVGTPHLLSMAALEGSLRMFLDAGMADVRRKSLHITAYLMFLVDARLARHGFSVGNPREDDRRGGHVCLQHAESYRLSQALKARGVVPDFREPDVIRLTPAALYTSYEDVYEVVEILLDIVETESYKSFSIERKLVV